MSFTILIFVIIVYLPSFIIAQILIKNKIPLKFSLTDYWAPIQLAVFGIFLPAIPLAVAYLLSSFIVDINMLTIFYGLMGELKFGKLNWNTKLFDYGTFVLIYYFICALFAFSIGKFLKMNANHVSIVEALNLLDVQKYISFNEDLGKVIVEVTVLGQPHVYSGRLQSLNSPKFFETRSLLLSSVLKIPISKASQTREQYLSSLKTKPFLLEYVSIPLDKITSYHERIYPVQTKLNIVFKR